MFYIYALTRLSTNINASLTSEIGSTSIKRRMKSTKNQNCMCQNGGVCVLQNDLCVCNRDFTGRFCEIDLSIDKQLSLSYSCGKLEHQYSEFRKCSKCTCRYNLLKCTPHWNRECATSISKLKFKKIKNKRLNVIKKYSNMFSNNSYSEYINDAIAYEETRVIFMNEFNFTKTIDNNFDIKFDDDDFFSSPLKSFYGKQKLIVITSNLVKDEVLINGIYYLNSNHANQIFNNAKKVLNGYYHVSLIFILAISKLII